MEFICMLRASVINHIETQLEMEASHMKTCKIVIRCDIYTLARLS